MGVCASDIMGAYSEGDSTDNKQKIKQKVFAHLNDPDKRDFGINFCSVAEREIILEAIKEFHRQHEQRPE